VTTLTHARVSNAAALTNMMRKLVRILSHRVDIPTTTDKTVDEPAPRKAKAVTIERLSEGLLYGIADVFGLESQSEFGQRLKSLIAQKASPEVLQNADPTGSFWVTTRWWIPTHCDWLLSRKFPAVSRSRAVFIELLSATADPEFCVEILNSPVPADVLSLCSVGVETGMCKCM
jgi:hypothetical protein